MEALKRKKVPKAVVPRKRAKVSGGSTTEKTLCEGTVHAIALAREAADKAVVADEDLGGCAMVVPSVVVALPSAGAPQAHIPDAMTKADKDFGEVVANLPNLFDDDGLEFSFIDDVPESKGEESTHMPNA